MTAEGSRLRQAVMRLMTALDVPLSVNPFWYRQVESRSDYRPFLQGWRVDSGFAKVFVQVGEHSTSEVESCYLLYRWAKNAALREGEVWECGVYRRATARIIGEATRLRGEGRTIRLFDTFSGIPESDPSLDGFSVGSLAGATAEEVELLLSDFSGVHLHPGLIPDTISGLEDAKICYAHVDVDQHDATAACCEFIYPRLVDGGVLIFDDYGKPGPNSVTGQASVSVVGSSMGC